MADEAYDPTMRELIAEVNPDALFMDDFDEALIGVAMRYGMNEVACYDYEKVIDLLMKGGIKDREGAVEFFEFNQIGAWLGENTPVFVRLLSSECRS